MMDSHIKLAAEKCNIHKPDDWCRVRPEEILAVHNCGPSTLDHLRIYLAARGLTLRDDQTPAYWQTNLASTRIGGQVSKTDEAVICPFTILVDSQEKYPYAFQGFKADADQKYRPLLVQTRIQHLGPTHGDYTIEGYEGDVHIERKSVEDAIGTFLSHGERLERWNRTLEFLAGVETAAVVVEGSFYKVINDIQSRGKRPRDVLRRSLHRQVMAWQQDWRIPFLFCDDRRFAELSTLQILRRHYRKANEVKRSGVTDIDAFVESL